jgi:hypothetical protein
MPAKVGSAGFDPEAFADVGQGGGEAGEVELLGLALGQFEEQGLEVGDLSADRRRVQRVWVRDQVSGLGWGEDLGCQEAVQWSGGRVVGPGPPAVAVGAEVDRFLGRGQVVEPVVDDFQSRFNAERSSNVS